MSEAELPEVEQRGLEYPSADWFLSDLVDEVNANGIEIGITLFLGGTVVTGILVANATYFEGVATALSASGSPNEITGPIAEALKTHAERFRQPEVLSNIPNYVHLRDAKFFSSGGLRPNEGTWWRGRITEVSGFLIGQMT